MKVLTNIFSREKSLLYFCVWNDSDRKGIELIGEELKNLLFIIPSQGEKGSVWYEKEELIYLKEKLTENLTSTESSAWKSIQSLSRDSWTFLKPYATRQKKIETTDEFETYYNTLVDFWTCLNSFIYEVLDEPRVHPVIKDSLIHLRDETEPYTEDMSLLLTEYVENFPKLKEVSFVITKDEALAMLRNTSSEQLTTFQNRLNGCFMLNNRVFPSSELTTKLSENNLVFEKTDNVLQEIKGHVAFSGLAQGTVKIVNGFNDLDKIRAGDILVTQMTNPKYTQAMTQVAAIVTDEGGSLCHAAITAREMKIPCIVGTKTATKTLRDGDKVEVDAVHGIVSILERAKE